MSSMPTLQIAALLLFLINIGSFSWAMQRYFDPPTRDNKGARLIYLGGTLSAILSLVGLLESAIRLPALQLAGVAAYLGSFLLFWWAIRTAGANALGFAFNEQGPKGLLVSGPYRFIRHPLYAAYLLTWLAGVMAAQSVWVIPPLLVMAWLYLRAVRLEESQFMASDTLGAPYGEYRRRTGRFIPRPFVASRPP